MSVRLKISILFVFALLTAAGYLKFYELPLTELYSRQTLAALNQRHLASVAIGLIPGLLESDLSSTHETLRALRADNPDWLAVALYDGSGRRLFPFSPFEEPAGNFVLTLEQPIRFHDELLGTIYATVDMSRDIADMNQVFSRLMITLGGGFGVIVVSLVLLIDFGVRRPARLLATAANQLAKGDFDAVLPAMRRGEIGVIAASFASMRYQIRSDREALSHAHDDLEVRVQKRTAELRAVSERLRSIAANVPGVFYQWLQRPDGTITFPYVSSGIRDLHGIEPEDALADPKLMLNAILPEDRSSLQVAMTKSASEMEPMECDIRIVPKSGEMKWVHVRSVPRRLGDGGVIWDAFQFDITQKKRAEEERARLEMHIRQANKLEALGTLAGGIAHDINNMLLPIMALTELTMDELPKGNGYSANLDLVMQAANRAKGLVEKILAFSRETPPEIRLVSLQELVREALELLHSTLPKSIEFGDDLDNGVPAVWGDPVQLHQVVLNLVTNAGQAINGQIGRISVKLGQEPVGPNRRAPLRLLPEGDYAVLSVRDTGCGIDPKHLPRIFDPFFTTKPVGEGTGMGLATVHGIVAEHGGIITVSSEPGNGTEFAVYLPILPSSKQILGQTHLPDQAMCANQGL